MRRKMIDDAAATPPELKQGELVSKSYDFELITPMFGGDYESFVLNEHTPIRSQSIKGQLRFWWRTMQDETNIKELLKKENAIWGGDVEDEIEKKTLQSRIKVSVTNFKNLKTAPITKERPWTNPNILASYVLFPVLNDKKIENPSLLAQASFTVTLTYEREKENEAMNSLLLWALFGGVGARTRRGCGSVYSEKLLKDYEINSILKVKKFMDDVSAGDSAELSYARMKGAKLFYLKSRAGDIKSLQQKYGEYRQARTPKRDVENHPGRSYWPEPDAIRRLVLPQSFLNSPENPHIPKHPDEIWFPRAAFGLPIGTQFNHNGRGAGDPDDQMLEPIDDKGNIKKRWPSPYIIKQIKIGSETFNIMLVLNQKFPAGLALNKEPLDNECLPANSKGKVMNTQDPLNGRTITQALADALGMEEA